MSKNHGNFFLAGLLGTMAGAIGGLLLAPQSGKATRKDIVKLANKISLKIKTETTETKTRVEKIFGKISDEAIAKYNEIKDAVVAKVALLKTTGAAIDKEKYVKVVDDVVSDFKSDLLATKTGTEKISEYLKKDWDKVKKALA